MKTTNYGAGVFTIDDYLTSAECAHYIERGEKIGFEESVVQFHDGPRVWKEHRNNNRVIFDDASLAALLFEKACQSLPQTLDDWRLTGFNERLRYYRYGPGEYFKWHKDGTYARAENEESFLTFMIYLNDGYEGGDTEFKFEKIKPRAGMALVFPHRLFHQSSSIVSGTKYVLRTDVIYQMA
jgi:prolyl 4-hydroxylase